MKVDELIERLVELRDKHGGHTTIRKVPIDSEHLDGVSLVIKVKYEADCYGKACPVIYLY